FRIIQQVDSHAPSIYIRGQDRFAALVVWVKRIVKTFPEPMLGSMVLPRGVDNVFLGPCGKARRERPFHIIQSGTVGAQRGYQNHLTIAVVLGFQHIFKDWKKLIFIHVDYVLARSSRLLPLLGIEVKFSQ